jgi:P4 family phage/plasmid primase-like protien
MGKIYQYDPDTGLWQRIWGENYPGPLSRNVHDFDDVPIVDPDTYEPTGRTVSINSSDTEGVINSIRRERHDYWDDYSPPFLSDAPPGVVFSNKFLQVDPVQETLSELDHDPSHAQRVGFKFEYDPSAAQQAKRFLHYLDTTFDDPDMKLLIGEIMGAGLLGIGTVGAAGRAFMFDGGKGAGKSTLLEILEALCPSDAISHLPPQEVCDPTEGAALEGARMNIVYETPEDDVMRESGFKSIIQGETVTRRAAYEKRITFEPTALHAFACNELPSAPGATPAFWDRWHVIPFDKHFRGTGEEIPNLAEKIIGNELQGVAAFAVAGAERLLDQGHYTMPDASKARLEEWKRESDPVKRFIDECTGPVDMGNKSTWEPRSDVWEAWQQWRDANGYHGLNRQTFRTRLKQAGITEGKSGVRRLSLQLDDDWDDTLEPRASIP